MMRVANAANCNVNDAKKIIAMAGKVQVNRSTVVAWQHARSVRVVPVKVCAQLRGKVADALAKSSKVKVVQRIVASNPRFAAQMPGYGAGNVFAMQQSGGQLLVYVF
jgi:hypothetical protein